MAKLAKLLQGAAGNAGGAGLDITDVFSTYLFKPNTSGTYPIVNNIDLDAEGGMVWMKRRDASGINMVHDTERWGGSNGGYLRTDSNSGSASTAFFSSFNSDGFTPQDLQNQEMASWTFRKAPKFFDCVTYTGTSAVQNISHSLGSVPGMIIVKCINTAKNWGVYHRSVGSTKYLQLNTTAEANINSGFWNNTDPTSTQFTLGTQSTVNGNGNTYVAYLFAHNDSGDGGFGPDGDQDIIKCGSYVGNESSFPTIDLGFEPQWVMIKAATRTSNWSIFDSMRGIPTGGNEKYLWANQTDSEGSNSDYIDLNATGFSPSSVEAHTNATGETFIYMAIRRGPLAPPESATEVFDAEQGGSSVDDNALGVTTGFPVDMFMHFDNYTSGGENFVVDRLRGSRAQVRTQYSNAEAFYSTNNPSLDSNTGLINRSGSTQNLSGGFYWHFKRAPSFFDVVAYTGTSSSASHTVNHNLTVAPEMVWIKRRNGTSSWAVYHNDGSTERTLYLETTLQGFSNSTLSSVGATSFVVNGGVLDASATYIMYLFASLDGVSKVGSYTGTGATLNIDCGFTSGARFVLIRRTDAGGQWFIFDSVRGIVSGNDPFLRPNNSGNEETAYDIIDPLSSGFSLTGNNDWETNISGGSYIFYAIA